MTFARVLATVLALAGGSADAHRASDAFLTLGVDGTRLHGRLEVALRDLDVAVAVDADADRRLTWGELRAAGPAIETLVARVLLARADGQACALKSGPVMVSDRLEGRFAWIALEGTCPAAPRSIELEYRLLFDVDPTHRGILVVNAGSATHSGIFSPGRRTLAIDLDAERRSPFVDYLGEGARHIWIGPDHLLFLATLLLPAVLRRRAGAWHGVERLRPALADAAGTITAFTVAHSLTLSLAALDVLRVPGALAESAIAASVLLAALNNLWPRITARRWAVAFAFGLVHGFGFASALGELGLPDDARLLALLGFNLGVEAGQLALVALVLPAAYVLRDTTFYRRAVLGGGSAAVAILAAFWLTQRAGLVPEG